MMGSCIGSRRPHRLARAAVRLGVRTGVVMALLGASGLAITTAVSAADSVMPGCRSPAWGGASARPIGSLQIDPATNWQPVGGEIRFTVESPTTSLTKADLRVCFRWHRDDRTADDRIDVGADYVASIPVRIIEANTNKIVAAAAVPELGERPSAWQGAGTTTGFGIVPEADMRVLVAGEGIDGDAWDITRRIGVTSRPWAAIGALGTVAVVYLLLLIMKQRIYKRTKIHTLLFLVCTARNYASLSQLQVMLWTFVVLGSVAYVMMQSGNLVPISAGTLVLLGIAGAATVGASLQSSMSDAAAKAPARLLVGATPPADTLGINGDFYLDTAGKSVHQRDASGWALVRTLDGGSVFTGPAAPVAAGSDGDSYVDASTGAIYRMSAGAWTDTGATVFVLAIPEQPQWRHLVEGDRGTIDPTRLQMLVFTVVTAIFVLLNVAASSSIPEIPQSYLTLMGISNGIYLASKFTH
jgi:hypothetical protein